jgi:hypothetical protein
LLFDGDCCSTGCCANAAPASASEQPISRLITFFIIIMFSRWTFAIYSGLPVISLSRVLANLLGVTRHRSPNHISRDRTNPVPCKQDYRSIRGVVFPPLADKADRLFLHNACFTFLIASSHRKKFRLCWILCMGLALRLEFLQCEGSLGSMSARRKSVPSLIDELNLILAA